MQGNPLCGHPPEQVGSLQWNSGGLHQVSAWLWVIPGVPSGFDHARACPPCTFLPGRSPRSARVACFCFSDSRQALLTRCRPAHSTDATRGGVCSHRRG